MKNCGSFADQIFMVHDFDNEIRYCENCGATNKAVAKFCGRCGKPLKQPDQFLRHNKKRNFYKKFTVSFLGIGLLSFSFFGISGLSAVANDKKPCWSEVKARISKDYRLTNDELDILFSKIIRLTPEPSMKININHLIQLEKLIKKRLRNPDISLFPNPFFAEPDRILRDLTSSETDFVFSDIPLDHPAYSALGCLFDIGLSFHSDDLKLRPYDKITWNEWSNALEEVMTRLKLNFPLKLLKSNNPIDNYKLEECFSQLRAFFSLPEKETFVWASDPYYPSRLEAFAALSGILNELLNSSPAEN